MIAGDCGLRFADCGLGAAGLEPPNPQSAIRNPQSAIPLQVAGFAGEPSGDAQAARLVDALRERRPDLQAWGIGGPALAGAGVRLEDDSRYWGAIGIFEAVKVSFSLAAPLHF